METLPALLQDLPAWFWEVPYDGDRYPGAVPLEDLPQGGNSGLFAYGVLAHFGVHLPPLRPAELWRDNEASTVVLLPRPLDLVLLHDREQAWGAHVGVVCSDTEIVHLSKEVGLPAVWTFAQFAATPRFANLIGFKRPL